jgi:uncharacterized membrane protein/protein-disulfide isomerase
MKKAWFWLALVLLVLALGASAVLFVDYVRPAPVFCAEGGGCAALRRTVFARPLGVPTPIFGLSGFFAIAIATCLSGVRARRVQAALAVIGALFAGLFIVVQIALHTICPYCAVVDTAAVALAVLSIARLRAGWDPPEGLRPRIAGGALVAAAVGLPIGVGLAKPEPPGPPVPETILAEIARSGAGKITVVDFIDFECPFCRATHVAMAPVLREHEGEVRLVRKHVPLRMHAHATDAARAAICAELLGKGEPMADALVAVPAEELTPEGCEKIAASVGLDVDRFRACVKDPATDARIRADGETFRASNGRGLPMVYVDRIRLAGEQDEGSVREAFRRAKRR